MIKRIILGTLIFTLALNTRFPYLHIKKDQHYLEQDIQSNKIDELHLLKDSNIQKDLIKELPVAITEEKEIKIEPKWIDIRISYYTNSKNNCGKTDGISANGKNLVTLSRGGNGLEQIHYIAAPGSVPFNTRFYIEGIGECLTVDRGSAIQFKNNVMWIDVFVANTTQSELQEKGVFYTRGYIIKD